jgi:hypothetical protein
VDGRSIFGFVPQRVVVNLTTSGTKVLSLAEFQTDVIHDLCFQHIIPDLVDSLKGDAVRYASPELVKGGMSADSPGGRPPGAGSDGTPAGDYPVRTGGSRMG